MVQISKFKSYSQMNSLFIRESERIMKNYHIDFMTLKNSKLTSVILYEIIYTMFENNSINLKISDVILLSLVSIGILSKENEEEINKIRKICISKNIINHLDVVLNSIKSIKNLLNMVFKKDGVVIQNIEQSLKYRDSIDVLNIVLSYIRIYKIQIKEFSLWFISDDRSKPSKNLFDYIMINYYICPVS